MSENLDLVHAVYANWEHGNWSDDSWADPEIEFVIADGPDPRSITGREAMASAWSEFLGAWSGYAIAAEEYRELGDDRVLVVLRVNARGKASGVEAATGSERGANVFDFRAGRVSRLAMYFDHTNALAELSLQK
jgi:hypothetical protein